MSSVSLFKLANISVLQLSIKVFMSLRVKLVLEFEFDRVVLWLFGVFGMMADRNKSGKRGKK